MTQLRWLILLSLVLLATACGSATRAARYNNQGNKAFEAQQFDEALDHYTDAQRENPDLAQPYYNAGNTFHYRGDLEAAVAQTQQAIRLAEDDLAPDAFYNLGNSFFRAQAFGEAVEAYKETLRRNPDDLDAKHNLELALQNLQQQQQQQQANQAGQQGDPQGEPNPNGQNEQAEQEQPPLTNADELSAEEAQQLLNSLLQDNQTLQERLQQRFAAPGPPPAQDW
ncbi:MAG: tetratricopeptide repeat protein [Anaerolineae bacterium]